MSIYLPKQYENIMYELKQFIQDNNLDSVTVSGLIQGSVVFEDPEEKPATIASIDTSDFGESYSVKASNCKVSLQYALTIISMINNIVTSQKVYLVLAILNAIVTLKKEATIQIKEDDAVVLFAIYRLNKADDVRIKEYLKELSDDLKDINVDKIDVDKSLRNLKKIKSIRLTEGKYELIETVVIS